MKNSVETNALTIGYGKAALARDIALGAAKGQVLALIGPNGAGKSTLLKTLAGQLAPLGGAVLLNGQELARISGNARAQKLALMLPHTRRTELTTCFEFAAAGRIPYTGRLGILSAEDKKQVQSALELVGAAHLADRDVPCGSAGRRRRVRLARAGLRHPARAGSGTVDRGRGGLRFAARRLCPHAPGAGLCPGKYQSALCPDGSTVQRRF